MRLNGFFSHPSLVCTSTTSYLDLSDILYSHSRTPPIFPPSLTLSRFPLPTVASETPTLYYVLAEILPLCSFIPLSLTTLNREIYPPESKDEDLHSGLLQMPAGTSLFITESGIQEGKLLEKGILRKQVIRDLRTFLICTTQVLRIYVLSKKLSLHRQSTMCFPFPGSLSLWM